MVGTGKTAARLEPLFVIYVRPNQQVEKQGKGCALIERKVIDFGELIDINGWVLTVAKGIDPILMIALISVKDAIKDGNK